MSTTHTSTVSRCDVIRKAHIRRGDRTISRSASTSYHIAECDSDSNIYPSTPSEVSSTILINDTDEWSKLNNEGSTLNEDSNVGSQHTSSVISSSKVKSSLRNKIHQRTKDISVSDHQQDEMKFSENGESGKLLQSDALFDELYPFDNVLSNTPSAKVRFKDTDTKVYEYCPNIPQDQRLRPNVPLNLSCQITNAFENCPCVDHTKCGAINTSSVRDHSGDNLDVNEQNHYRNQINDILGHLELDNTNSSKPLNLPTFYSETTAHHDHGDSIKNYDANLSKDANVVQRKSRMRPGRREKHSLHVHSDLEMKNSSRFIDMTGNEIKQSVIEKIREFCPEEQRITNQKTKEYLKSIDAAQNIHKNIITLENDTKDIIMNEMINFNLEKQEYKETKRRKRSPVTRSSRGTGKYPCNENNTDHLFNNFSENISQAVYRVTSDVVSKLKLDLGKAETKTEKLQSAGDGQAHDDEYDIIGDDQISSRSSTSYVVVKSDSVQVSLPVATDPKHQLNPSFSNDMMSQTTSVWGNITSTEDECRVNESNYIKNEFLGKELASTDTNTSILESLKRKKNLITKNFAEIRDNFGNQNSFSRFKEDRTNEFDAQCAFQACIDELKQMNSVTGKIMDTSHNSSGVNRPKVLSKQSDFVMGNCLGRNKSIKAKRKPMNEKAVLSNRANDGSERVLPGSGQFDEKRKSDEYNEERDTFKTREFQTYTKPQKQLSQSQCKEKRNIQNSSISIQTDDTFCRKNDLEIKKSYEKNTNKIKSTTSFSQTNTEIYYPKHSTDCKSDQLCSTVPKLSNANYQVESRDFESKTITSRLSNHDKNEPISNFPKNEQNAPISKASYTLIKHDVEDMIHSPVGGYELGYKISNVDGKVPIIEDEKYEIEEYLPEEIPIKTYPVMLKRQKVKNNFEFEQTHSEEEETKVSRKQNINIKNQAQPNRISPFSRHEEDPRCRNKISDMIHSAVGGYEHGYEISNIDGKVSIIEDEKYEIEEYLSGEIPIKTNPVMLKRQKVKNKFESEQTHSEVEETKVLRKQNIKVKNQAQPKRSSPSRPEEEPRNKNKISELGSGRSKLPPLHQNPPSPRRTRIPLLKRSLSLQPLKKSITNQSYTVCSKQTLQRTKSEPDRKLGRQQNIECRSKRNQMIYKETSPSRSLPLRKELFRDVCKNRTNSVCSETLLNRERNPKPQNEFSRDQIKTTTQSPSVQVEGQASTLSRNARKPNVQAFQYVKKEKLTIYPPRLAASGHYYPSRNVMCIDVKPLNCHILGDNLELQVRIQCSGKQPDTEEVRQIGKKGITSSFSVEAVATASNCNKQK